MECPYKDLRGKGARELVEGWLGELPGDIALVVGVLWEVLQRAEEGLRILDGKIKQACREEPVLQELVKHPGFGAVTAYCVWAEVGEIERFGGAAELISYAGLAPRSEDSDAYQGRRRLPKRCSKRLRYLMVLAAQGAARSRWWTKAKATYRRVKGHHGANTAKIAAARDLLRHVFHTWRGLRAAEEAAA